ncbi:MAG: phospholipid carrier-dependent glycosyltransferase [Elusimicrobiota bacterium]|jgi:hypothetical protein
MSQSGPRPPAVVWPACFSLGTLGLALVTAASFFWPVFRSGLWATLLLAAGLGVAVGCGRAALARFGLRGLEAADKTVLGATLGLGLLSLVMFALAAGRLLHPGAVALVLALLGLAGLSELRAALAGFGLPGRAGGRPVAAALVGLPLALVFWAAWVPPHQYDSLVYHLALPQAYLHAGGLTRVDHLVFSHFPQNGEMLFTLALALKSDLLAQLLMWAAAALSAAWLWVIPRTEAPDGGRWLACLLLVTHTAVLLLASTTYVEPLVMLWTTAAALSFWRWRSAGGEPVRGWLTLSAVFTGLALGTKYYAGATAGIIGLMLLVRWAAAPPGQRRPRFWELAWFVGLTALVFAPWLIKNYAAIGNPVFPFFYQWFESTRAGWPKDSAQGYFKILTEYGVGVSWWRFLAVLPFQLLGNSLRFGGGMDVLGDMGWEILFWSLPLALWASRGLRMLRWLAVFCGLYLAVWLSTGVVLRFLTALAPLLCLLAGCGLHALWGRLEGWGRRVLAAGLGLLIATHLLVFLFAHQVFGSGTVLLGTQDRETFLAKRLEYYPCAVWARENLGINDRILIVGEQRGYYVAQPHAATTVNASNPFRAWAESAADPADYGRRLRSEGFGYILLVPREAQRLEPALGPLSERGRGNLSGLEPGYMDRIFQAPGCSMYRLR